MPPPPGEGKGRSGAEGRRATCGVEEDITQEVEAAPIVVIRTRWGGMAEGLLRIFFVLVAMKKRDKYPSLIPVGVTNQD